MKADCFTLAEPRDEDVDRLIEINESALPEVSRVSATQMLWFLEQGRTGRGLCRIAIVEPEIVVGGIAGLFVGLLPGTGYPSLNYRWFEQRFDDFAYIDRVVVTEQGRRRGIARGFYAEFERWAQGQGQGQVRASRLTCEVNLRPPNPGSMAFHEAMGFVEVGRQETESGKKEVRLMARTIGGDTVTTSG